MRIRFSSENRNAKLGLSKSFVDMFCQRMTFPSSIPLRGFRFSYHLPHRFHWIFFDVDNELKSNWSQAFKISYSASARIKLNEKNYNLALALFIFEADGAPALLTFGLPARDGRMARLQQIWRTWLLSCHSSASALRVPGAEA